MKGIKGSTRPKSIKEFEPGLAKRIRSAWFDSEITSRFLRAHFHFSDQTMLDLAKELGPRQRPGPISTPRGKSPRNRLTNGH